jgi:hypothetical protein
MISGEPLSLLATEKDLTMKYFEHNEDKLSLAKTALNEKELLNSKELLSQNVSDLMREKCPSGINININIGSQNDSSYDKKSALGETNALPALKSEDDVLKYDPEGNAIRVPSAMPFKKGMVDESASPMGTASGDLVIFKNVQENEIKVPRDGGPKASAYVQYLPHNFLNL